LTLVSDRAVLRGVSLDSLISESDGNDEKARNRKMFIYWLLCPQTISPGPNSGTEPSRRCVRFRAGQSATGLRRCRT
jgi:hypothetical protein